MPKMFGQVYNAETPIELIRLFNMNKLRGETQRNSVLTVFAMET